jgi:hypothetical protein
MRGVLTFSEFAQAVENRLWLLGVESGFTLDDLGARWTCVPYTVAVEAVDAARARALICVDRKLRHVSGPARMTAGGAETLARAVGILFGGRRVAARCAALDLFCHVRTSRRGVGTRGTVRPRFCMLDDL